MDRRVFMRGAAALVATTAAAPPFAQSDPQCAMLPPRDWSDPSTAIYPDPAFQSFEALVGFRGSDEFVTQPSR